MTPADHVGDDPVPHAGGGAQGLSVARLTGLLNGTYATVVSPALTGSPTINGTLAASRSGARPVGQGEMVFNVRDYGATGDGSTDDSTAIASARAAAVTAGGGTVYFPAGTYITGPIGLYTNVRYQGAGRRASILKLKSGSNADFVTLASTSEQFCEMFDLTIDGNKGQNGTNGGHGIHLLAGSASGGGHRFFGLAVRNCAGIGIYSEGTYSGASVYVDIQVYACDNFGYKISSHDNSFLLCDTGQSGLSGFRVEGNNNRFFECNAWFSGRITPSNGHGWYLVGASRSYLVGCQAQDSQGNSFTLFNITQASLFNCISDGASANGEGVQSAQNGVGFGLVNATNCVITGRAFNRFATLTSAYGLTIGGTSTDNRIDIYVDPMATGAYTGTLTGNRVKITSPTAAYEVDTSRPGQYAEASRTSGNVLINSTTLTAVDTGLDLTVAAQPGDLLEVGINIQCTGAAVTLDLNVATYVAGAEVNRIGGTGTTGSIGAWTLRASDFFGNSGVATYKVVSGDVSSGQVTLRLLAVAGSATGRTIIAGTTNPLKWWVRNLTR